MPRIAEPVWLTMMSGASEKNQLCHRFMKEFAFLMEQASKNQYSIPFFFFSFFLHWLLIENTFILSEMNY